MGERLYGLDALRGVAAIAVAGHHLARIHGLPWPPLSPSIAVDLFFILSGFVMTRTYEGRLRNGLTTLAFIGLRYRRLFMPLAIGSTIGLALAVAIHGPIPQLAAAYILILCFLPAIGPAAFLLNGPAWSLFVEIISNSLHGAFFARMSNAWLLALIAACGLVAATCFATGLAIWTPAITSILWLIPRELTCYLVGIWMFRRYGDTQLGGSPGAAVVAFTIAPGLASINSAFEIAALIAAPFIIRASLGLPGWRWAISAGALSYPLYATHVPVMQAARAMGLHPLASLALAAAVAIVVTLAFEIRRPLIGTRADARSRLAS